MSYFSHNNECRLEIFGIISSCDIVLCVFVGPMQINVPVLCYYKNRTGGTIISEIMFKSRYYIFFLSNIILLNQV